MCHRRSGQRLVAVGLLSVLVVVLSGWLGAGVASAHHGRCGYHTEAEYRDGSSIHCRGTDTIAPPVGRLLDRNDLLANAGWLTSRGFDRSFLWFAPRQQVRAGDLTWSFCGSNRTDDFNGSDDVCDDQGEWIGFESADLAFGNADTPVTILGERNAFIALVCGNFSQAGRSYHPQLTGTKFHDLDLDGLRDAAEPLLAGWEFQVTLVAPALSRQQAGVTAVVTTGADGRWNLDLTNLGPGTYRVEELPQDGWGITTQPAVRTVTVAEGIGDTTVDAGAWGNVREADTAKSDFRLLDPPSRMDADRPTDLTVQVALTNHGPADVVDVTDSLTVTGPEDCTITPARQTVTRTLREGETALVDLPVQVLCTEPSDHAFTFEDRLTADGPMRELRPENNTASLTHVIEVFDDSDLALSGTTLDCAAETEVRESFACTGTITATNTGPYGPTDVDLGLELSGPADCVITADDATERDRMPLEVGAADTLSTRWTVVCSQRSYHVFTLAAGTAVDHVHVEDHEPGNDTATATDTVEVFEDVDLAVAVADLTCTEREANRTASACAATVDVTNSGPADAVQTLTDVVLTPGDGCTASAPVVLARTLAAGESVRFGQTFAITCTTDVRHEAQVDVHLRNAPTDPHAADSARDRLLWLPSDAKPTSLPSSVNVGKDGAVPFALISTTRVDAVAGVDRTSVRYGTTGTEDSVTACRPQGEDVDGDGRSDLICHADTRVTGITCDTTVLVATGRLTDGIRFVSQDDVKVTGCRR